MFINVKVDSDEDERKGKEERVWAAISGRKCWVVK